MIRPISEWLGLFLNIGYLITNCFQKISNDVFDSVDVLLSSVFHVTTNHVEISDIGILDCSSILNTD
ncbi:hypothetical protein C486_17160 [Natrinema gari JCM 14663]|uniref:Uncharacterized protein n=1 Tax=Natrinema gari JCM 14663 TaxID=1230459 RepID=L9YSK0_9EURY|nr:hypothetical protein C486_17160 [Natrinema gari JCM 14663]